MNLDYPHKLSREEARERLVALGEYWQNRHGMTPTWDGDSATIHGKYMVITIEGRLQIDDEVVHFSGKDPGRLWRNKALKYVTKKLDRYLDPSVPVSQLPRR